MPYVSDNEAIIHVSLAGVTFPSYIKTWATFDGGDPVAETGQLLPGNVLGAVATPGPVKRSNVTVEIPMTTDLQNIRPNIDQAVNNAMSASYQTTDAQGNPNANPFTVTGLMKQPKWPKWDPTSGKVSYMALTMECNT